MTAGTAAPFLDELGRAGRLWLRGVVTGDELEALRRLYARPERPGARLGVEDELFQAVAQSDLSRRLAQAAPGMRPVRLVAFEKRSDDNWSLPWHQDRVVAARERVELEGVSNWSRKGEIWHCEPPRAILDAMLFVRLHLDACDEDNGAMEIAVGSHAAGLVAAQDAATVASSHPVELTCAQPGDALILPMLTLHRSRPSRSDRPRRALRIDYASGELPPPLRWTA